MPTSEYLSLSITEDYSLPVIAGFSNRENQWWFVYDEGDQSSPDVLMEFQPSESRTLEEVRQDVKKYRLFCESEGIEFPPLRLTSMSADEAVRKGFLLG